MAVWEVIDSGQPDPIPHMPGTLAPAQPPADPHALRTERLRVANGWLYRVVGMPFGQHGKGLPPTIALAFVPENTSLA